MADDCVFCAIERGDAPAQVVYRDGATLAFMDHAPLADGHVLVIPRRHVRALWELDEATAAALMQTTVRVADAVNRALAPEGMNLFHSTGAAAGQDVFHVHVHVVPRNRGDRFQPPVVADRAVAVDLARSADRIRQALGG